MDTIDEFWSLEAVRCTCRGQGVFEKLISDFMEKPELPWDKLNTAWNGKLLSTFRSYCGFQKRNVRENKILHDIAKPNYFMNQKSDDIN